MIKPADCHTHTNFSPDAKSSPEQMCEKAMELGLAAYAITDHCDCNFWFPPEHYSPDPQQLKDFDMHGAGKYAPESIAAQVRLKEKLGNRLNIIVGIELGQPMQYIDGAEKIAADENLDFIIGSHHQNRGKDDFYWIDHSKLSKDEIDRLLADYFSEILEMCRWGKFDVLGHLTYPLRYICGDHGIEVDLKRYEGIIREIFSELVKKGKGIEINTSGLRQKYGKTMPSVEYVRLFRELGGEIITLGSDAHCADDLGKGISDGAEIAREAGFRYIAYFKKHTPEFIRI